MNTTGNWDEQKGKLLQKFAILTDDDFWLLNGKKDEIFNKLQITLVKTKEELQRIIKGL